GRCRVTVVHGHTTPPATAGGPAPYECGLMRTLGRGRIGVVSSSGQVVVKMNQENKEDTMQYVLLVYRGDTPVPGTDEWNALAEDEQKQIYAGYQALATAQGSTPGTPVGLPDNATTVRAENGKTLVTDGPYVGIK